MGNEVRKGTFVLCFCQGRDVMKREELFKASLQPNCSLKEAKDYIDNLRGYDPKNDNGGCLGVVALLVLLSSTAIYFCL